MNKIFIIGSDEVPTKGIFFCLLKQTKNYVIGMGVRPSDRKSSYDHYVKR